MTTTTDKILDVLERAAAELGSLSLPTDIPMQFQRLAAQVGEPCVVAVVGRVKAGKSTFVNALLGEDLAKVGSTETTATINYFRYGQTNPDHPIRCYWRSGGYTQEDRAFLDSLQGYDVETLRRAEGIDHLEFHLLNPYLQRITLVDTPGTQATVDEHQDRTAAYLGLYQQMRERQEQETRQIGSSADAVIYLVGVTANVNDLSFLEEFGHATQGQSRALNAIGVLAKIDLDAAILQRRDELSAKIGRQLHDELNIVVPVSAGIEWQLRRLLQDDQAGLRLMMETLRRIPPPTLTKLLHNERLFRQLNTPDCPVSTFERERLLDDMPQWRVFTTIAGIAAAQHLSLPEVIEQLTRISGFIPLKELLERQFLQRGHLLRCFRIINDARRLVGTTKFVALPRLREHQHQEQERLVRYLGFIQQSSGDPIIGQELIAFLQSHFTLPADAMPQIEAIERDLGLVYYALEGDNADFAALQQLEAHTAEFQLAELDELRALFGLYGLETEKRLAAIGATAERAEKQQQSWQLVAMYDRSEIRRQVAEHAVVRYGHILDAWSPV